MYMQTAFFFAIVFPPPTAGSEIFTGLDGSCTWRTTNTHKSSVMQYIVRYIIFINVSFHFFCGPVQYRVVFYDV